MGTHARERLDLEAELRGALERAEFRVYYQPKVELATGKVQAVEALVRWEHPERGLVPPGDFIHIAEEVGLIVSIGRWVLEEACRQVRSWQCEYGCARCLRLDVNLSARQFSHLQLAMDIGEVLRASGLDAGDLELEITESAVMEDPEVALDTLSELKGLGVRLAVDDFGMAYSSLSYLKRFPVDTIKIDRSFVMGLGRDPDDEAIVRAVIGLGRSLHLEVVAEGVETAEQRWHLRKMGCEMGQGYLFARPVPGAEAGLLLAKGYLLVA